MVSFDIVKFHFNCYFKVQFGLLNINSNSVSDTLLIKELFKGCGKLIDMLILLNEFLWKLGSCFFEKLGILWETKCLQFEINQLFLLTFKSFMVFVKTIFECINHDLYCSVKYIFSHKSWSQNSSGGLFIRYINVLVGFGMFLSGGIHHEEYKICWACRLLWNQ